jgi:hypothetical protein
MRAHITYGGWDKWVRLHKVKFLEMIDAGLDVTEVWSNKIVEGNYDELQKFLESCNIEFNKDMVDEFVEPEYYSR